MPAASAAIAVYKQVAITLRKPDWSLELDAVGVAVPVAGAANTAELDASITFTFAVSSYLNNPHVQHRAYLLRTVQGMFAKSASASNWHGMGVQASSTAVGAGRARTCKPLAMQQGMSS